MPSEASVVNQVLYQYDTNGNLDAEYQEHGGAVQTSTSIYVAYGYDDSTTTTPSGLTIRESWGQEQPTRLRSSR